MRIVCPSCQAVYDVPDALLAPSETRAPAKLRCARCAAEWAPAARPDSPSPSLPAAASPAGPTPSPFADALAQAIPARPAAPPAPPPPDPPPVPEPAPATASPVDAPAPRPSGIDAPAPPPRESLVAEHLAPRRRPPHPPAPPPRNARDSATLLFAWCLSLGVLAALLIAAYLHRGEVIAFWPPAARVYDLLRLR